MPIIIPKSRVLIIGNLIKAAGAALLLCNVEPLIAYCVVGVGAAIYSPAKYGILPELAGHEFLVKANSWIEGSTILAILLGMMIGAKVADYSIAWALTGTIVIFIISALTTLFLPAGVAKKTAPGSKLLMFWREIGTVFFHAAITLCDSWRFFILGRCGNVKGDYRCLGAADFVVKKCIRNR